MRFLGTTIFIFSMATFQAYGYGFKKKPVFILNEVLQAITSQDEEAFLDVTGREALCIYGNEQGIAFLNKNLSINFRTIDLKATLIESKYYRTPVLVGSPAYWSYFNERYMIEVKDKAELRGSQIKAVVDCDYGFEGHKNDKYRNLKPKKYKKKECLVTKIIPVTFGPLKLEKRCEHLKVNL